MKIKKGAQTHTPNFSPRECRWSERLRMPEGLGGVVFVQVVVIGVRACVRVCACVCRCRCCCCWGVVADNCSCTGVRVHAGAQARGGVRVHERAEGPGMMCALQRDNQMTQAKAGNRQCESPDAVATMPAAATATTRQRQRVDRETGGGANSTKCGALVGLLAGCCRQCAWGRVERNETAAANAS